MYTHAPSWSYGKFTSAVWSAYERNKITGSSTTRETLTRPSLHRFRHSVATGLLNEGWSQYEVQKFLGHYVGDPCQVDHDCFRYRRAAAA